MFRAAVAVGMCFFITGCSSNIVFDPETRFPDADQRWHGRFDSTTTIDHLANLTGGGGAWRFSADAPTGMDFRVLSESGTIDGHLGLEQWPFKVAAMHWHPFQPDYQGPATVSVDCTGPCAYAIDHDHGPDATLPDLGGLATRYGAATARFHEHITDDYRTYQFDVPTGTEMIRFRLSVDSPSDWIRISVLDANGDRIHSLRFPGVVIDDLDATLPSSTEAEPGSWRVVIDCEQECEHVIGIYVD